MQHTPTPNTQQHAVRDPQHYIAVAHEMRSAMIAMYTDRAIQSVRNTIARAVQWLNSHPALS